MPTGNPGSGLTILTGPNNGGKSSILECLRARLGNETPSFTSGTRNKDVELVEVVYVVDGKEQTLRSVSKGSSETIKQDFTKHPGIFVVPSRKTFSPYFSKGVWSRQDFIENASLPPQRSAVFSHFEYRLFNILQEPAKFNELLSRILGYTPEWTIDRSDQGPYFLKFFNSGHSHSSDGMGEGLISIFSIVDSLYDSEPGSVIAIDEPELSLHPALQKRTAGLIEELAKDRQIIVSTHSPYFVSLVALANGGHLARVATGTDGTTIHQLSDSSKEAISMLADRNYYNPHVFGLDARELFFQEDHVILTEGQEDVMLYPLVAEQLGMRIAGSFFGWGAGGAGNIPYLCRILSDLGFKKVAGLLDGNKTTEAQRLSESFPSYFFRCIPAEDIRTKPARGAANEVSGLLDAKLTLKAEHRDATSTVLAELSRHMDA
ncbi:ATP-dependent nuclease [Synechococcus sp. CBW1107]|uniref:ATP-dependent nuclease n=1 Tax=Synechococcus sp. CBW1107 TaxID=2789857 RepID=UPI002AD39702|nr:AAA family ATPase [Synechococcus sp. CBW1107]